MRFEANAGAPCQAMAENCYLKHLQGIECLRAPSEGEAYCAVLNKLDKVDVVWTTDVVDAFMFGAKKVLRGIQHGKSNQAVLCYRSPATSAAAVLSRSDMAQGFGCSVRPCANIH